MTTTRVRHDVVIHRPLEDVFAFTVDPANVPLWQPAVVKMRQSAGPFGPGTRVTQTRRLLGRRIDLVAEVYAYEPLQRLGLRITSGGPPGTAEFTFRAVPGGTKVELLAEVPFRHGLLRAPLAEAARRELVTNGERLRSLLEGAGTPDPRSRNDSGTFAEHPPADRSVRR